ncbi:hypothetical protein AADG42_12205 [Ammonicoccus fulvus]|uniref:Uncharacterized protein n=1 Tax=Ammonicoccus fulvus TaxID=3138240 RepID=A0ABZ3FPQ9_9ACTN
MTVDLGREQTIPAWWSSTLWVLLGVAAGLVGWLSRRRHWFFVAALAWAASVDEYAELHERLDRVGSVMQGQLPVELAYAWVIPGSILAASIGVAGIVLFRSETAHTRSGLIWAGVLFLGGAVVLEVAGSLILEHFQMMTWHFAVAYHVEEIFEMLGVTLGIVAVLARLMTHSQAPVSPCQPQV